MSHTLREIATLVAGDLAGDGDLRIRGVRSLEHAADGDLSFITDSRYRDRARTSLASAFLVSRGVGDLGRPAVVVEDAYRALADVLHLLHPEPKVRPGVHPTAVLGEGVEISPTAVVGPHVVVGAGSTIGPESRLVAQLVVGERCSIGARCVLHPGVVLYDQSEVGDDVTLQAGVVVGSDGFGYASDASGHRKLPHVGRAVLEGGVEVGANSTIDRGMLEETRLGAGTKVDNLVMVAHNVEVGEHCLLVAQSGVAGSAHLGNRVVLAAQSGIIGHVEIGDGVVVATKSALLRGAGENERLAGIPARDLGDWKRMSAVMGKLPQLLRRVRRLESEMARLGATEEE